MKVVAFSQLNKKKKKNKIKFFCVSKVFRNCVLIFTFLFAFMLLGIFNGGFTTSLKETLQKFIADMGKINLTNFLGL